MKFTCIQEDLSRALSIVSRAVSSKEVLPVTQNVSEPSAGRGGLHA